MACDAQHPSTIIAGFGLPGREMADRIHEVGKSFCVIELNPTTVQRCTKIDVPIIAGDCTDPAVLKRAGIERATLFIIAIPDEKAAVEATAQARRLNPSIRIIARCHYTSTGIVARANGADDVVVAEQVVAAEMSRMIEAELGRRT
jgi:monovalent cation:H+ antiporter-2, CPA2 family